jgi:hypothetical protein
LPLNNDGSLFDELWQNTDEQLEIHMQQKATGRWLLTGVAILTTIGGFAADWNRTHLFNPRWTPHAKFHDALTILLSTLLGGSGLYFLWSEQTDRDLQLALGTLLPMFFWGAQAGSFLFPGVAGLEAEFPELVPQVAGIPLNEGVASALMLSLASIGYALERRRLR